MRILKAFTQRYLLYICVFSVTFVPINVLAIEGSSTEAVEKKKQSLAQTEVKKRATKEKCQSLDKISARITEQLSQRTSKVEEKRAEITAKFNSRQDEREAELAKKRAEWDEKRKENFDKLRARAETDAQKEAVEAYVIAMTDAIKERRDANDAAFKTFQTDLGAIRSTLSQSVQKNMTATSGAISQAVTSAKSACESGQDVSTVLQDLKNAISTARDQAKSNREGIGKSELFKAVVQKRNDAIKANSEAFKLATEEARSQLKAAFNL